MILMWLGPVILMLAGIEIFRRAVSSLATRPQTHFLELKTPVTKTVMLATSFLAALSQASLVKNQFAGLALINARVSSRRYAILLLCLAAVGMWSSLLVLTLAWQLSGFYLLALSLIPFLIFRWTRKGQSFFKLIFGLGLALAGAEWTLRQQSVLLSLLGETEFHFLLADGRFPAQLLWLAVGLAVTLLIGFESWSIFVSLVLVGAGSMSLNGAVGLIVGELLAHAALIWWQARPLNADARNLAKGYAVSSCVGLLVGFILAGLLRDAFAWNFTFDASQLVEKSLQLAMMLTLILVVKTIFSMTWGHFAAQHEAEEVQTGNYFSPDWQKRHYLSESVMSFVRNKLALRLRHLQSQASTLPEAGSKIPMPLLKLHSEETQRLTDWMQHSDEGREKF